MFENFIKHAPSRRCALANIVLASCPWRHPRFRFPFQLTEISRLPTTPKSDEEIRQRADD